MPETAVSDRGVVAAPHHAAAETGRMILAEGGDAYEAMAAMAATIAVVYPHMNAIGGDGFWLVREPNGHVRYIEACGAAGSRATAAFYRDRGHDVIPARGPLAALTVPGAVNGWRMALELSQGNGGGRIPLRVLTEDAIRFAREGTIVSRSQARTIPKSWDDILPAPGFAETYLKDGKILTEGETLRQPRLADTLDHLARAGLRDFYVGDVARAMAEDLDRIGAPVSREDLAAHRAVLRPPLSIRIEGGRVYNSQPPTQGLASLVLLGVLERLKPRHDRGEEFIHAMVEATKRAFLIRDRVCTDFDRLKFDPEGYLTPERLDEEADAVDLRRAAPFEEAQAGDGDTVWMGAIDGESRAVSYIQSIFWEYGSGCVLPATGVLMQNRGASFSLNPKAVNPLEPGRRPFHTLNPPLAAMDDGRVISYGTMGGEGQPQTQALILARHLWHGRSIADAVDAPRVRLGRTWGEDDTSVKAEPRVGDDVAAALRRLGHEISMLDEDYSDEMGHAGMIVRQASGRIEGVHDPRSDGGALGV